ncbi:uncharacterized protein BO97DRAFT_462578 [Aspergillus homomorphus CBS 101889]|uniref:Cytochrome P450 n=1 Tax=Aspergillus homomorphus (strain CBS 101889) TaxID=1450537 RepID=A0A395HJ56_ASPHC|nr:hypothetical protein BO97DRAFT_462578 [Aspergillus homomorphus CBS 101889]RAL07810.1 hypothetical protein BO97DRAFT_462578 [Aspergillus homomorphus CBS 101889]
MSEEFVLYALLMGVFLSYVLFFPYEPANGTSEKTNLEMDVLEDPVVPLRNSTLAMRTARRGTRTLKNLWRLNNPFVSDSVEMQASYRRATYEATAKVDDRAWGGIARAVATAIRPLLSIRTAPDDVCTVTADLRHISLNTSLAAVLKALFDMEDIPHETLSYLGSEIHRVTMDGKRHCMTAADPHEIPADLRRAADSVIQCLQRLFTNGRVSTELAQTLLYSISGTPDDFNPLNLLLPAFEAPWRTTLYTLLAILQPGPSKPEHLLALRDCPAVRPPDPKALAIAYESLRLYPPIRRISRVSQKTTSIDIEAIQRDPARWGPSALRFDPGRFLTPDGQIRSCLLGPQQSAWIPFAVGTMKCPSARAFSTRMMVVVVGEILRHLFPVECSPDWEMEGAAWDFPARAGETLRAGREEYQGVCVVSRYR